MGEVAKVIQCPCGYVVEAETEDDLVERAQRHARRVHEMDLSRDQVLAMAHPA